MGYMGDEEAHGSPNRRLRLKSSRRYGLARCRGEGTGSGCVVSGPLDEPCEVAHSSTRHWGVDVGRQSPHEHRSPQKNIGKISKIIEKYCIFEINKITKEWNNDESYKYNISYLCIHELSRAKQLSRSITPSGRVYIIFDITTYIQWKPGNPVTFGTDRYLTAKRVDRIIEFVFIRYTFELQMCAKWF